MASAGRGAELREGETQKTGEDEMRNENILCYGRRLWLQLILVAGLAGSLVGCCPVTSGINLNLKSRTSLSKAETLEKANRWFDDKGYRLWQREERAGYIRAAIARDSSSLGFRVEDVLAVTVKEQGGRVEFEVGTQTYKLGQRREIIKVSLEGQRDASSLKASLASGGAVGSGTR
jgi:hypothetical protein